MTKVSGGEQVLFHLETILYTDKAHYLCTHWRIFAVKLQV